MFVQNINSGHTIMMLSKEFCIFAVYNFEPDQFPTSHHRHANSVEVIPTTHFFLQWFHRINQAKVRIVIFISRNGLLKSCARFIVERSEIRKRQHDFKSVHFECRMVLFYTFKICASKLQRLYRVRSV